MVTIVDYGMGNLGSIQNMFSYIGVSSRITSDLKELADAEKILLPGVGAFDSAMERINSSGIKEVLDKKALEEKVPVLGICLGMQLLTKGSNEGELPGLGWIPAYTHKFEFKEKMPVPHMGWNEVEISNSNPLSKELEYVSLDGEKPRFYFVHSFHVQVENQENSIMKTHYGLTFDSAIRKDNVLGCQFHPEKSHKFGMTLLKNFAEI